MATYPHAGLSGVFHRAASWLGGGLLLLSFILLGKHPVAQAEETASEELTGGGESTPAVQDSGSAAEQVTYVEPGVFGEPAPPTLDRP